jgi:hypothetical protein
MKKIKYVEGSRENLTPDSEMEGIIIEFYNSDKDVFETGQSFAIDVARALVIKREIDNICISFGDDWEVYSDDNGRINCPPSYNDYTTNTLMELA